MGHDSFAVLGHTPAGLGGARPTGLQGRSAMGSESPGMATNGGISEGGRAFGMKNAKIILRLPDGKIIIIDRELPKLPLGLQAAKRGAGNRDSQFDDVNTKRHGLGC